MFSIAIHSVGENLFSIVAWSSSVILMSQFLYSSVTMLKYCKFIVIRLLVWFKYLPVKALKNTVDNKRSEMTTNSLFCNIDVFKDTNQESFKLTRGNLWRLFFPVSISIFFLFICFPIYDASCSICLSLGFLFRSIIEENNRGSLFQRPISRRVLFSAFAFFGVLSFIFIFTLSILTGLTVTNENFLETLQFMQEKKMENYAKISEYDYKNHSNVTYSELSEIEIVKSFLAYSDISNPNLLQYVEWSMHSYPQRMSMLWILCFTSAFLLSSAPMQLNTKFVLETSHTSISMFAAIAMCILAVLLNRNPFVLLGTSTPGMLAYLLITPITMWFLILKLFEYQQRQTIYIPSMILIFSSLLKHCIQYSSSLQNQVLKDVSIITGIICGCFVLLFILFLNAENTAVRSGWGEGTLDNMPKNQWTGDEEEEMEPVFTIEESVETVISNAKKDLELAQSMIADESKKESDSDDS